MRLLLFVLAPEVGLGEEAMGREGRKGGRKVTRPLSVPSESDVFVHSRHYDTSISHMTKSTHTWQLCQHGFVGFIDHNQKYKKCQW